MRKIISKKDCSDCLFHMYTNNACDDSGNFKKSNLCGKSECSIGDAIPKTEEDCRNFLPDKAD